MPPILGSEREEARAVVESVLLEDGVAGAVESVIDQAPGGDPISTNLALLSVLAGVLAEQLRAPAPLATERDDATAVMDRWETVLGQVQGVLNQVSAARAAGVAHYARHGTPDPNQPVSAHPAGYRDEFAGDQLAPVLGLGPREADTLVDESVWLATRTPRLLAQAATGHANLGTVAAIARELQDARPDTCERVEQAVLSRGVHRATRVAARRSARTLVERFEAAAARRTRSRSSAQQTGVWLDSHPTPGLSLLSAAMPTPDAEALMTAIEHRAAITHRGHLGESGHPGESGESGEDTPDGRTLGQHRADALRDLALQGVTLTTHLDVLLVTRADQSDTATTQAAQERPAAPAMALLPRSGAVPAEDLSSAIATWPRARTTTATLAPGNVHRSEVTPSGVAEPGFAVRATDTYRPSISLRRAVIRRDRHCRFPGCTRPARWTDLDHVRPWPHGPTTIANLQCLCRRHHRAKHQRWRVTMTTDGLCTWTSPTGRTYVTRPGLTTDLANLDVPAGGWPTPESVSASAGSA